ncbi:MAG: DUF4215 domain-containing protein [Deltaproteobacteria bacterium]|nr:DUF4215 domain-containing protein [Deltaproteobacteria bacterium]
MTHGSGGLAAAVCLGLAMTLCAAPTTAQVSTDDQRCITAFNKGIRNVAKAHGRVARACLQDFARGRLVASTPELCVRSDPRGALARAVTKAAALIASRCPAGLPGLGVSPVDDAMVRTVIGQLDLLHASYGRNLDQGLIANAAAADCQARVGAALFKCQDTRLRAFLKCQQRGLRNGAITDAASLAATCLGSGAAQQPDEQGQIAGDCVAALGREVLQRCTGIDLTAAFAPCETGDVNGTAACLTRETACALCLTMRDVDAMPRDCDLFDDGNAANGSCGAECGDGVRQGDEVCDDGNRSELDGCSATCTIEGGWTCGGAPSVCTPNCPNGLVEDGELCDDANATDGDGCSARCTVEPGYACTGTPSACAPTCGNGELGAGEGCDDGNHADGDGCSASCRLEDGFACSGEPSSCGFVCGNGSFQAGESCDDADAMGGDGCSAVCRIEPGWLCFGVPSFCMPVCGDGVKRGAEACDDGNVSSGDGCAFDCHLEPGYSCGGEPSHCLAVCGDGVIRGGENCDDGNAVGGDGCSAPFCRQEPGFTCVGQPSACSPTCGNGTLDALEGCDDGNHLAGDGCSNCQPEPGAACGGQPSICVPTCGNGVLNADESCDDGNQRDRDGCSASCRNESGWLCNAAGQACQPFAVHIDTPAHGVFSGAAAVTITGHYSALPPGQVAVTVNGVPAQSLNPAQRTFSHTVALDQAKVFNPVHVALTNTANGDDVHDRIVVIAGGSVADGALASQSVAMRVNDLALDTIEPLVGELAADQLDLATLLPANTELINECFISIIGCWGRARVRIANPPPSFSTLSVAFDSKVNTVYGDIRVSNLRIDVDIDGSGLVPDCGLRLTADALQLTGDYGLGPLASNPSQVDVNLVSPIGVSFSGFNHRFTYGLCNAPLIGDIIQALLPDIQDVAVNGIRGFLGDPDGVGPNDSPVADAIESTLAGISVSGAVGSGLGLLLDAPLFQVVEDNDGITFGADSRFTVSLGSGPGQCLPPPGAPDFSASYAKPEAFPSFGPTTPVGHLPYGIGIAISTAGFNQLLRGQTECGLLRTSLTTIDLDGDGGAPPLPINSSLLALLVPQFGQLPPATPLRIDVTPTLAPIVTGNGGPSGELTDLTIAQVRVDIVEVATGTVWLSGALDARLGMRLDFLPDGSGLAIVISEPLLADLAITVVTNPLGAVESQVETVLPAVIRPLIPDLAGALSGFPLPQFFGLNLAGVEVSRSGQFLSLFANLEPAP